MVNYVRTEMKVVGAWDTLKEVADIATRYFQEICPKKENECDSTIFLCSWMPGHAVSYLIVKNIVFYSSVISFFFKFIKINWFLSCRNMMWLLWGIHIQELSSLKK